MSKILEENFEFFQEKFKKAGCGELVWHRIYMTGDAYKEYGLWSQRCIILPTQETLDIRGGEGTAPILVFDDYNSM